jgi:hypothetical protein
MSSNEEFIVWMNAALRFKLFMSRANSKKNKKPEADHFRSG